LRRSFEYFRYVHLGFQFCILVAGGVLGGWWLDGQLGILPLFTIVGTMFGTGAAIYILYRSVFDRKSR
jgi:F0F1-type ATP synthase assembly protein I